jgi:glyoxylase-like metal-dependent hydrolase (beta-lactamase superfamily II)
MTRKEIYTLDLNFQNKPGAIASYLIPHRRGAVLVESGPGSTLSALQRGLEERGLDFSRVTDVLLTHIHLDHAGAAGWLARQGARIHVHPVGAPHLLNPDRLLESAARIYGEMMQPLWGDFLSVPEDRLSIVEDNAEITIEDLHFRALDTPGHASHHHSFIFEDTCFTGDIGGIRLAGFCCPRPPTPPPDFHLEKWRSSLERLRQEYNQGSFTRVAPTHFGIYEDAGWHLESISGALEELADWMEEMLRDGLEQNSLRFRFSEWTRQNSLEKGLTEQQAAIQEAVIPSSMSADGLFRYWRKYRKTDPAR